MKASGTGIQIFGIFGKRIVAQSTVSTSSKRMYIAKNFIYFSSKTLFNMLFRSFVVSLITCTYFLPITFTCLYARDKKCIRKIFLDTIKLRIEHPDIDSLITKLNKTLALRYIHEDAYFINDFIIISKCPSGQYHSVKYRSLLGRDSFLCHLIHTLNDIIS